MQRYRPGTGEAVGGTGVSSHVEEDGSSHVRHIVLADERDASGTAGTPDHTVGADEV